MILLNCVEEVHVRVEGNSERKDNSECLASFANKKK